MHSYQKYEEAPNKEQFLVNLYKNYVSSSYYDQMKEAEEYFKGDNRHILNRQKKIHSILGVDIDLVPTKVPNNFFKRLVIQQNETLLAEGVILENESIKQRLGFGFDRALNRIGEKSLIHGKCFAFWDYDKIVMFPATEFIPLYDVRTHEIRAGLRFVSLGGDNPIFLEFYEVDGKTVYQLRGNSSPIVLEPKTPYRYKYRPATGDIIDANYNGVLPIFKCRGNEYEESELTKSIKRKIDLYDMIFSDYGDSMGRVNGVLWVFNNYSGTAEDLYLLKSEVEKLGIIANLDESTAEPRVIELQTENVKETLRMIENSIYRDFMAMDLKEVTGGSLTNVAIRTAQDSLLLKVSRFEWEIYEFTRQVLCFLGVETDFIRFELRKIANEAEQANILAQFTSYLDEETILKHIPIIKMEEVENIMERKAAEDLGYYEAKRDQLEKFSEFTDELSIHKVD